MFILLDVSYLEKSKTFCERNGNSDSVSDIDLAKEGCSADDNCVGFQDSCGSSTFLPCNAPLSIGESDSSCGTTFYQRIGK